MLTIKRYSLESNLILFIGNIERFAPFTQALLITDPLTVEQKIITDVFLGVGYRMSKLKSIVTIITTSNHGYLGAYFKRYKKQQGMPMAILYKVISFLNQKKEITVWLVTKP